MAISIQFGQPDNGAVAKTAGATSLATTERKKAAEQAGPPADSAAVQISLQGQIKSAVAEVQTASAALADKRTEAAVGEVRNAALRFVAAYNNAATAANRAAQGGGPANGPGTGNAVREIQRTATEGTTGTALSSVGIASTANGTLAVDSGTLDRALRTNFEQTRNTLSDIGRRIEQTAASQLSAQPAGGESPAAPARGGEQAAATLRAQQEQASQAAASQRVADEQAQATAIAERKPLTPPQQKIFDR